MTFSNIPSYDATTAGNNTDVNGVSIAEGYPAANINNAMRNMLLQMKQYLANSVTLASASSLDLGAQTGNAVTISGTATITGLGTVAAGTWKDVTFSGALLLTYNATSLILPGAADITTAAGDTARLVSLGSGNWQCTQYTRVSGLPIVNPTVAPMPRVKTGLIPVTISGTSTTAAVSISAGAATDTTSTKLMISAGHSWAVSNGNAANGYQGGTTLPTSSAIHFYEISGTSGEASFASTSLTPTLPSGYTLYKRTFSLFTNGSGALIGGTCVEMSGGGYEFIYSADQPIFNAPPPTTASLINQVVPTGFSVRAIINAIYSGPNNTQVFALFTSPFSPDTTPTQLINNMTAGSGSLVGVIGAQYRLMTNTSGQIRARCSAAGAGSSLVVYTVGYEDPCVA